MVTHNINNHILALSNEHRFVLEHMATLESILKETDLESMADKLISIESKFMPLLTRHFKFEEEIIFPAALEGLNISPVISQVLLLTRQHGELERWAKDFFSWAHFFNKNTETTLINKRKEIETFSDIMRKHSQIEVVELFPKISENPRCCQFVENAMSRKGFVL